MDVSKLISLIHAHAFVTSVQRIAEAIRMECERSVLQLTAQVGRVLRRIDDAIFISRYLCATSHNLAWTLRSKFSLSFHCHGVWLILFSYIQVWFLTTHSHVNLCVSCWCESHYDLLLEVQRPDLPATKVQKASTAHHQCGTTMLPCHKPHWVIMFPDLSVYLFFAWMRACQWQLLWWPGLHYLRNRRSWGRYDFD